MDRQDALAYLNGSNFDVAMEDIERTTDDTSTGYAVVLDRAFGVYIQAHGLETTAETTTVVSANEFGFMFLLDACAADIIVRGLARMVDMSVDAPLSNFKFSQAYRQWSEIRKDSWNQCAVYGYGNFGNVSGFKVNLDFLEPRGDL